MEEEMKLLEKVFSVKNEYSNSKKYKLINIIGLKIKIGITKTLPKYGASIDITTNMGCSNNCVYCPQSVLLSEYYKNDKNRKSILTFNDFKFLLDHQIPKNIKLIFGAFSEPFENPECIDMILYAAKKKRLISVYTTLKKVTLEELKKIEKIPFVAFCVHTPDADKLQQQEITDEYLEKIKLVKTFNNVGFMVIGRSDERINKILEKTLISQPIISRGNNLDLGKIPPQVPILKKEKSYIKGPIICSDVLNVKIKSRIGKELPTLLPDGTILLCCMDWAMKNQLGNLFKDNYKKIMKGDVIKDIERNMSTEEEYVLCRDCEYAIPFDENKWKNYLKTGNYCLPKSERK